MVYVIQLLFDFLADVLSMSGQFQLLSTSVVAYNNFQLVAPLQFQKVLCLEADHSGNEALQSCLFRVLIV